MFSKCAAQNSFMMGLTQARDTLLRLALDLGDSPPGRLCAIFTYARKMSLVPLEPRKVAASALFRALYAQRCFEGHHHEAASMAKKIIILADGTGNAFTRQESNIWRLYDSLDLTQADHLAYYVQGVGTSSFRPWATIDAATGLGVPENVRRAYEYLC